MFIGASLSELHTSESDERLYAVEDEYDPSLLGTRGYAIEDE